MSESINISELMKATAKDAIDFAANEFNVTLDYSEESVSLVQAIISKIDILSLDDNQLFTLSFMYGAYLGEVFIQHVGGNWLHIEESEDEPPQTFVAIGENTIAFPGKVYQALTSSDDQNLDEYYCELVHSHQPQAN
ncbi:hypothetical protein [Agarivorans gilvus]|uniref:DUF3806 domain-containing protein n=1 Tax=Agarivorans gilvus TaxID=680279 RepID=A0ABQ1I2L0_9ALTE|nr:hypothetical protein [Agarivorans gilvus]GGB10500.1 hypothetical protein GCM10007414_24830 [Agarivorans gilvus]